MAATAADNPGAAVTCDVAGLHLDAPGAALIDRDRWPALSADGRDFGASVTTDGRLAFGVQNGAGAAWTTCTAGVNVLDGAWHHIALQRAADRHHVDLGRRPAPALAAGPRATSRTPTSAADRAAGHRPLPGHRCRQARRRAGLPVVPGPGRRGAPVDHDPVRGRRSCARRARSHPTRRPPRCTTSTARPASARPTLADATGHGERSLHRRRARAGDSSTIVPPFAPHPAPQAPPAAPAGTSTFHPISPARLIDTRPTPLTGGRHAGGAGDRGERPGDGHGRRAQPHGRRTRPGSAS